MLLSDFPATAIAISSYPNDVSGLEFLSHERKKENIIIEDIILNIKF